MPKQYFHSLIIKKTLSKFFYLLTDQTEEHNGEQDRDDDVQYGEPEPRIFKQFINKLIVNQLPYYLSNWGLQKETPVFTCCWHWGSPAFSMTSDIHRSWPTLNKYFHFKMQKIFRLSLTISTMSKYPFWKLTMKMFTLSLVACTAKM